MSLTDTALKAIKPKNASYFVSDDRGLYVEVLPSGSIVWRYRYRLDGKREKLTLGRYPALTLKNVWEDIQPKLMPDGTLYPQVPDSTAIERPITDTTQPGGPIDSAIRYTAPFTLADREADYRVAWKHFSEKSQGDQPQAHADGNASPDRGKIP